MRDGKNVCCLNCDLFDFIDYYDSRRVRRLVFWAADTLILRGILKEARTLSGLAFVRLRQIYEDFKLL
jgi:hypothetical protein